MTSRTADIDESGQQRGHLKKQVVVNKEGGKQRVWTTTSVDNKEGRQQRRWTTKKVDNREGGQQKGWTIKRGWTM